MSRITYLGFVFVLAAGCVTNNGGDGNGSGSGSGSGSGGGGGSGSGGGGGGGGAVTPAIGAWHYAQITPVTNTCNPTIDAGEAGDFGIDATSTTSFHVLPNDGTDPFTCTLSNSAFDCPNRAALVHDYRPGVDAVVTVHVIANGTFSDAAHAIGMQQASVECAGSACVALGAPCTVTQNFAIVAL